MMPSQASWLTPVINGESLPQAWGHTMCAKDGVLYILSSAERCRVHAVDTRTWTCRELVTSGDTPPALDSVASVLYGDKWVLFGGTDGERKHNSVYVLNLALHKWERPVMRGDIPSPREGHAAVCIGSKMYTFGGNSVGQDGSDEYVSDVHCLDLETFVWSRIPVNSGVEPAPRDSHATVALGGRLLVLGGDDTQTYRNDVWAFDPATRTWTEIKILEGGGAPYFEPRASMTAVPTPGGEGILVFGGALVDGTFFNDCWLLEVGGLSRGTGQQPPLKPGQGRWIRLSPQGQPPPPRFAHAVALIDDVMLVSGGTGNDELVFDDLHALRLHSGPQLPPQQPQGLPAATPQASSVGPGTMPMPPHLQQQLMAMALQKAMAQQQKQAQLAQAAMRPGSALQQQQQQQQQGVQQAKGQQLGVAARMYAASLAAAGKAQQPVMVPTGGQALPQGRAPAGIGSSGGMPASALLAGITNMPAPMAGPAAAAAAANAAAAAAATAAAGGAGGLKNVPQLGGAKQQKAAEPRTAKLRTSYNVWQWKMRPLLRQQHPNMDNRGIESLISNMWSKMTDEEKAPYKREADKHNNAVRHLVPERKRRKTTTSPAAAAPASNAAATPSAAVSREADAADALLGMDADMSGSEGEGGSEVVSIGGGEGPAAQPQQPQQQQQGGGGGGLPLGLGGGFPYPYQQQQQHGRPPQLPQPPGSAAGPGGQQQAGAGGAAAAAAAAAARTEVVSLGLYAVSRESVGCRIEGVVDGVWGEGTQGGYTAIVTLNGVQYRALLTSPFLALQPPAAGAGNGGGGRGP